MTTRYRIILTGDQSTLLANRLADSVEGRVISMEKDYDGRNHARTLVELPDENVGRLAEMCDGDETVVEHGKQIG